jgi:hypothetical protein
LYGYETWPVRLKEEHRWRVFEKMVLGSEENIWTPRGEVVGELEKTAYLGA